MVNGRSVARFVAKAQACGLPMGLHLNLTEGTPVSAAESVPTLVVSTEKPVMRGKAAFHEAVADAAGVNERDIATETLAQVAEFARLTGREPRHVDGHQHCHVPERAARAIAKALGSCGSVKTVRLPELHEEESRSLDLADLPATSLSFYRTVSAQAVRARDVYRVHGILAPRTFLGFASMGCRMLEDADAIAARVVRVASQADAAVPAHAVAASSSSKQASTTSAAASGDGELACVELMSHPGNATTETDPALAGCGGGPDEFAMSADREAEIEGLRRVVGQLPPTLALTSLA